MAFHSGYPLELLPKPDPEVSDEEMKIAFESQMGLRSQRASEEPEEWFSYEEPEEWLPYEEPEEWLRSEQGHTKRATSPERSFDDFFDDSFPRPLTVAARPPHIRQTISSANAAFDSQFSVSPRARDDMIRQPRDSSPELKTQDPVMGQTLRAEQVPSEIEIQSLWSLPLRSKASPNIVDEELINTYNMKPENSPHTTHSPERRHKEWPPCDFDWWLDEVGPSYDRILPSGLDPSKRSRPTSTDSPSFASEGEASFVLGKEPLPAAEQYMLQAILEYRRELAETVVNAFVRKYVSAASDADASSSSPPSSSSHQANPSSTAPSSGDYFQGSTQPRERKRGQSEDGEDGDDERHTKKPNRSQNHHLEAENRLLACPYTKFQPRRYSERNFTEKNYRGCSSCYLRNIPRLKLHLYRVHNRPRHYCPRCFSSFKSAEQLELHIVEGLCQSIASPFPEKMSPDQVTAIKRRDQGKNRVEAWFDIYGILFPGALLPLDPYIDSMDSEPIQNILALFEQEAPQILATEINTRMFGDAECTEEDRTFRDTVLEESISVLIQRFKARMTNDWSLRPEIT